MEIKPLKDFVLCEKIKKENTTASGIITDTSGDAEQKVAKILKIGPEVTQVKDGDSIIFKAYASDEVEIMEQEYLLIRESDIIAIKL